jgi:DNA-binding NtrC family response regulator
VTPQARDLLLSASWPGNVRQLQNAIERLVVLCEGDSIGVELVREEMGSGSPDSVDAGQLASPSGLQGRPLKEAMRSVEAQFLRRALAACGGKRGECARHLGISPRTLLYKLKEYNIH